MLLKESAPDDEYRSEKGHEKKRGLNKIRFPYKRMHSCKRKTDVPRSKTFIYFHMEVCTAGMQFYFRFSETTRQG